MSSKTSSSAVLVFLKAPVPGRVKTRLARDLGEEGACWVYCQMVQRQLAALPGDWPVEIHFSPQSAAADFSAWLGDSHSYHPQPEGDLGWRLRVAASGAFDRGHQQVILIGGDCPGLQVGDLQEADRLLGEGADVVMGPASDGGYYLLGLRANPDVLSVFDSIPWSSSEVAQVTSKRIDALGLRLIRLAEKEDVDDLAAYLRAVEAGYVNAWPAPPES